MQNEIRIQKAANRWFENITILKYLKTSESIQNLIYDEVKGRSNVFNAC
jgi:hypothetical protein